jgi:DNA-binding transcriptional LysR family regulator
LSYDWGLVQDFLATARGGSTLAASKVLNVSQSTVARRIDQLEQAMGARLFIRRRSGYVLTARGRSALIVAEAMEQSAQAYAAVFPKRERLSVDVVRIDTSEHLASALVEPALAKLRRKTPDLKTAMMSGDVPLDLMKGEAEIALRTGGQPTKAGLVSQKAPDMPWGVYCSPAYAELHGMPQSPEDLPTHRIIRGVGALTETPAFKWLNVTSAKTVNGRDADSLRAVEKAIKAGEGVSVLPRPAGDFNPGLVFCFGELTFDDQVWLTYPAALRKDRRLKQVLEALTRRIEDVRSSYAPRPQRAAPAPAKRRGGF